MPTKKKKKIHRIGKPNKIVGEKGKKIKSQVVKYN